MAQKPAHAGASSTALLDSMGVINMAVGVEEMKLQLLARSVLVPGLPNLLFSLVKSSGEDATETVP